MFPSHRLHFDQPLAVAIGAEDGSGYDTYVPLEIDPNYDARYPGEDGFFYQRLSLALLQTHYSEPMELAAEPFSVHAILPEINRFCGLQLVQQDVLDLPVSASAQTLVLQAAATSLVWVDSLNLSLTRELEIAGARLTEDGSVRLLEDGSVRIV